MEKVKVWYDSEGDFLEVIFENKEGYFKETESDQIMEKVDMEGNVIGFCPVVSFSEDISYLTEFC